MFGKLSTPTAAAAPNAATGLLFGAVPQSQQSQPTQQNVATATPSGPGIAASLGAVNTPNINTTRTTTSLPSTSGNVSSFSKSVLDDKTPGTKTARLLKDLIQSATNLPKSQDTKLGVLNLPLSELQRILNALIKNKEAPIKDFTRAHYFLASNGISTEDIESELAELPQKYPSSLLDSKPDAGAIVLDKNSQVTTELTAPGGSLETYLGSRKDENILNSIEQSLQLANDDFDTFINASISIDWKARKDKLRLSIGLKSEQPPVSASAPTSAVSFPTASSYGSINLQSTEAPVSALTWNKPSIDGTVSLLEKNYKSAVKNVSRDKFESHAKVIYQMNEARLKNEFFPLCLSFEEINKLASDLKSKQMIDVWKYLIELTNEKFSKISIENKFNDESRLNSIITKHSKKFLEQQFYNYVDEIYLRDDAKPEQFSPATNINKVSFFIHKIVLKNNPQVSKKTLTANGTPVWAIVFYLFRCGLYQDALHFVDSNRQLFNMLDTNFPTYLMKFVDIANDQLTANLPLNLNERLHQEFNTQFSMLNENDERFDPYKYSLYKIIGKCDLSKKYLPQSINLSIEDWVWFHLSIINEDSIRESSLIFDNYYLADFQQKVLSLGPKVFNSSSNNPLYLKTLILSGLFEVAINYTNQNINECAATHLAIALKYYGLLKVAPSNNKNEVLVSFYRHSHPSYFIDFAKLLELYTRSFKISDPKVAAEYLILIAMSTTNQNELNKCYEFLRQLILITREFSMLLGELNEFNGEKIPGLLEQQRLLIQLENLNDFNLKITEICAIRCEEEGRIFDALLLYQSCQEYNTVVALINKLLSELISTTDLDKPLIKQGNYNNSEDQDTIHNNIVLLSQHIIKVFRNSTQILEKITPEVKQTNQILLPIVGVRQSFIEKDWRKVILEIKELGLLPLDPAATFNDIRELTYLIEVNKLDSNLIKVIPSLLIMVLTLISQLNYNVLQQAYQPLSKEREEVNRYKTIAKNCMVYAGMVQYKMPRETYSLLINLESLL